MAIGKNWLFDLLEIHFDQSEGEVLSDIRTQIGNLDRIDPLELGGGYQTPGGLRGWILGKNDVMVEDNHGLKDSALAKAFRTINVVNNYRFKDEAIRQTKTVDFVTHLARGAGDQKFRGGFSPYMRAIGRHLRNEFNGHNSRWGISDT